MELTPEQLKKLEDLATILDKSAVSQNLPVVEELRSIGDTLKQILEKETPAFPEIPAMPEIPEPLEEVSVKNFPDVMKVEVTNPVKMPEIPKLDMTETNTLLQELIDKEDKLEITLEII